MSGIYSKTFRQFSRSFKMAKTSKRKDVIIWSLIFIVFVTLFTLPEVVYYFFGFNYKNSIGEVEGFERGQIEPHLKAKAQPVQSSAHKIGQGSVDIHKLRLVDYQAGGNSYKLVEDGEVLVEKETLIESPRIFQKNTITKSKERVYHGYRYTTPYPKLWKNGISTLFESTKSSKQVVVTTETTTATAVATQPTTTIQSEKQFKRRVYDNTLKNKTAIILVAFHRSGSSFTGELLNIHPDIFYFYEPLKIVADGCGNKKEERLNLLRDLIDCKLPDFKSEDERDGKILINEHLDEKSKQQTKTWNWMFRPRHKLLCSSTFCNNTDYSETEDRMKCGHQCPPVEIDKAKNICQKPGTAVGFKLIRLCEIDLLEELIESMPHVNFKIVFLNRDPRGIYSSRKKIFGTQLSDKALLDNLKWTCRWMSKRFKNIFENEWLMKFSKFFRYESISKYPLEAAKEFYEFLDLKFLPEVEDYVKEISKSEENDEQNDSRSIEGEVSDDDIISDFDPDKDTYQTSKNSNTQYHLWRTHIDFDTALDIQKICEESMALLGYRNVENESNLKNLTESLLGEVCFEEDVETCKRL